MSDVIIENPILNGAFREPARHFRFADEGITNEIVPGRRSSSYFIPIARPKKKGKQLAFDTESTQDRIEENKGRQGHDGAHPLGARGQQPRRVRAVEIHRESRPVERPVGHPPRAQSGSRGGGMINSIAPERVAFFRSPSPHRGEGSGVRGDRAAKQRIPARRASEGSFASVATGDKR